MTERLGDAPIQPGVNQLDDLRARAHNFVAYFEQQLRNRLRTEERTALERIIAAKFGFDDDALRAAVEAETERIAKLHDAEADRLHEEFKAGGPLAVEKMRQAAWHEHSAAAIRARKP